MKHVFIIGSKGIPAKYGGFETFVENLTKNRKSKNIKYHVSCMALDQSEFEYNGAHCFNIPTPTLLGNAKAIYYDIASLRYCIKYIQENNIEKPIIYILACRIGPIMFYYKNKFSKLGAKVFLNPDGHEWLRAKWNVFIRKYWKISEADMVKHADLVICDSRAIENYIKKQYEAKTAFVAYGAEKLQRQNINSETLAWLEARNIKPKEYYLIIGRFIPENNLETIIAEFIKSDTKKKLIIVSNIESGKFQKKLLAKTNYQNDRRILFVGTIYDQELIGSIRANAYAYIHGHEVGGTNPSLLESMAATKLNLLFDNIFNREVAQNSALYWNKNEGMLSDLIEKTDSLEVQEIEKFSAASIKRIKEHYSWEKIVGEYERLFL